MQNLSCKNEFYLRDKKNHIHINGFVLCISLEQRLEATRKGSIVMTLPSFKSRGAGYESVCYGISNTLKFGADQTNIE